MSIADLAAALAKVQAELPKLERDRTVVVTQKSGDTYSYSYATLANLSETVLPLLAKNGLSFVAMPGAGSDGKMCVRYHLLHESGEEMTGEFPISGEGGIQMIGGRITYARRYCLAAIVGVAADEDDEARLSEDSGPRTAQRAAKAQPVGEAAAREPRKTAQRAQPAAGAPLPGEPERITEPQMRKLQALFAEQGFTAPDDKRAFLVQVIGHDLASTRDLTKAEARKAIDRLENRDEPPGGDA